VAQLALAVLLALAASVTLVWAFAEEPLQFRDPDTGQLTGDEVSSLHDDLTYVLALAAGFSISDSRTLQVYDQLVDSEQIVNPVLGISYSNCGGGAFYPPPEAAEVCGSQCAPFKPCGNQIWPTGNVATGCVTSRYGVYSPFFHFPHQNVQEVGALHDWGWGLTTTLRAYEAYA
jgi:hypothetical protein